MGYTLLAETFPKARKEHRCIWCGQKILTGEAYRRERSVYDGVIQDHKWHLECDTDAKAFFVSEGGEAEFLPYSSERPERRAA